MSENQQIRISPRFIFHSLALAILAIIAGINARLLFGLINVSSADEVPSTYRAIWCLAILLLLGLSAWRIGVGFPKFIGISILLALILSFLGDFISIPFLNRILPSRYIAIGVSWPYQASEDRTLFKSALWSVHTLECEGISDDISYYKELISKYPKSRISLSPTYYRSWQTALGTGYLPCSSCIPEYSPPTNFIEKMKMSIIAEGMGLLQLFIYNLIPGLLLLFIAEICCIKGFRKSIWGIDCKYPSQSNRLFING